MFEIQKITYDTVGDVLRAEREKKRHSLRYVSEKLNIREEYLGYLEDARYQLLPPYAYSKHFVAAYINFLGLDEQLLNRFERESKLLEEKQESQKTFTEKISKSSLISLPQFVRILMGVSFVSLFLIYIGWSIYKVISPPYLALQYPVDDMMLQRQSIHVLGVTSPGARVLINNEEVFVAEDGAFEDYVGLLPGLNIVEIASKKKYSRETTSYRRIVVDTAR